MKKRRPIPPRSLARVFVVVLAVCLPVWAGLAEDADRAWSSGDHAKALRLYERVLDEQPENFQALLRSAKLLSWNNRFDEAIERYDRAIAVDPNDREALLGRALTLSWDRRFTESRSGFAVLLEDDPSDVDALLGLARTYAWSSHSPAAGDAFRRVLDTDPDNVDARIGLAYLDLWAGEIGSATEQAVELKQEHPEHQEVVKLYDAVSRSAGAWWSVDVSQIDDTDDNRMRSYLIRGGLGLGHQLRLDLGAGRYDMSGPSGDASIDNLHATIGFHPTHGQRLSATVGFDARTHVDNTTENDVLGGLSYSWGLDRRWQVHGSALRNSIRYSPEITDNNITFDQLQVRANGAAGKSFRIHADVGVADFSDGNDRLTASAGFLYRLPVRKVTMDVGYTGRAMDYDQNLANGYFDPQDFLAHLAQFRVNDEYGNRGNYYRLRLDTGVQSFTLGGVEVNNDAVLVIGGLFGFPVGERMTFEAYAEYGDYAAATASGFASTIVGVRLLWRAGL
jgi:tetratricopeptide (TPR) repeat protein